MDLFVISWSQALYHALKPNQTVLRCIWAFRRLLYRVAYVLFVQSSFNGFHVHRWQVVSSQSWPHFDPITLFYISLSFEITWFNQQQGMKWMCHHVAIIPLVTSVVRKKNLLPRLKPLGFNQSLPWIIHVLQGVTQFGNRWVFHG